MLVAIGLLLCVVGGYLLGYSDGKVMAQHESNVAKLDALVRRVKDRNRQMLRLIRGGKG